MTDRNWHHVWVGQCEAAEAIKLRYGIEAAFDYAVAEKLVHFVGAAAQHPEFARELPRFVSWVRSMFTQEEIRTHLARIEHVQLESDLAAVEDDDLDFEDPASVAERVRQFAVIKDLLTAPTLGTS